MRRRTIVHAALLAFLISLLATGAAAQLPGHVSAPQDVLSDSNITVHVFGPNHEPLKQMAFVTLYQRSSTVPLGTIMTTVSSEAVLTGMPNYGPYTVKVFSVGYETTSKDFEYNQASGRVYVDVTLKLLSTSTAAPSKPKLTDKAQEHVDKGLAAMQAQKFDEAIAEFEAALKESPDSSDVCYLLGAAYQKNKDLAQAQKYLQMSLTNDPDNVQALVAVGQLHDQQKDYQGAIAPLEKAATLDGQQWLGRWVLADAYLHTGDFEKALKSSQAAVEIGKGSANKAELIEGQALAQLGRRDEAIAALQKFTQDLPNDPAVPAVQALITKLQNAPASAPPPATPPASAPH
jgi:Flp pilus assembly protein TadD